MRVIGLASLSLYVRDLDASKRFYSEILGLPLIQDESWGVELRAGSVGVFLHPRDGGDDQHVELVLDVEDLATAFAELHEAGAAIVEEPTDREWGDRDGAITDPDGNTIYLRHTG
jgi:catechol 2,3-dioxygenase-like lactoylglutathione lyase family enzyme